MNRLTTALTWAYHSTAFFAVCLLIGLAALGGYGLWRTGVFGQIAATLPQPATVQPLKVRIHGESIIVRGSPAVFAVEVMGLGGTPEWQAIPKSAANIKAITADGRIAEVLTLSAASELTITVLVAGQAFQIAHDQIDVEIVDIAPENPPEPEAPPVANNPPPPPAPPTVAELTAGALAAVESHDRAAEARTIAGSIKSLIGRLQTGQLPPDADVIGELELQVQAQLGERSGAWHAFLIGANLILDSLRSQGQVTTAASSIPALSEMAAVLSKAQ